MNKYGSFLYKKKGTCSSTLIPKATYRSAASRMQLTFRHLSRQARELSSLKGTGIRQSTPRAVTNSNYSLCERILMKFLFIQNLIINRSWM